MNEFDSDVEVIELDSPLISTPVECSEGSVFASNIASTCTTKKLNPQFNACYILQSQSSPKQLYVGYSCDPIRRLKQHNGILKNGAKKTLRCRPWSIICVIFGFLDKLAALQFEWAWQHPGLSRRATRPFQRMPLQIFFMEKSAYIAWSNLSSASLPIHALVKFGDVEELALFVKASSSCLRVQSQRKVNTLDVSNDNTDAAENAHYHERGKYLTFKKNCGKCKSSFTDAVRIVSCPLCWEAYHVTCFGSSFTSSEVTHILPDFVYCVTCGGSVAWMRCIATVTAFDSHITDTRIL
ncbi:GIY-YIG catalytic domain-containing protein [Cardiosporidium cionae]|uniref:GIY-YIG catalytic domain-containing protein n=1 Tax=Cardiosporidium cionae TaxID=476202 RepID=A0ABQ7JFT5_9APIC|nr:GIY-YIG catalytic domain-containing protein [Cardiosporidium cionae]|eukprot:KAF8822828.1 GIY-YIG catalytic domain-containing protein [Cardiosporidium cionae]